MHVMFCDKCGKSIEGDRGPMYTVHFGTSESKIFRNRKSVFELCRNCAEKAITELEANIKECEEHRINGCECE